MKKGYVCGLIVLLILAMLTGTAVAEGKGEAEVHLPVLSGEVMDEEIPVKNAWLVQKENFSVCVTGVTQTEGGISLGFQFESTFQTRPDVSIPRDDMKVNGESFDGTWFEDMRDDGGNGYLMLVFADFFATGGAKLPTPIETVSFTLIVTDAELAEPFTKNVTLIFDGAVTEPPQEEASISLENALVVHMSADEPQDYLVYMADSIGNGIYELNIQRIYYDKSEWIIYGDADSIFMYEDDEDDDEIGDNDGYDWVMTHFNFYKINDTQVDLDLWATDTFRLSVTKDVFPDGELPEDIQSVVFSSIEIYAAKNEGGDLILRDENSPDYETRPVMLLVDGDE